MWYIYATTAYGAVLRRRRLAERGSRFLQCFLNFFGERVRTTEHAPRDPSCVFERRHGLAQIVGVLSGEKQRVNRSWPRRWSASSALNETAWSALVGMAKKTARDAAKAELAAE